MCTDRRRSHKALTVKPVRVNCAEGRRGCFPPSCVRSGFRHVVCVKCVAAVCTDGKNTCVSVPCS